MSILTRYICRRLILYYSAFLAMMVVFFVFVDFMEHIERITRHHAPLRLIALYYACLLPKLFIEMSWVGFLVSLLFVLGSLAKNNEFTAMLAGGISIYKIAVLVFAIGTLLGLGVFCMQEFGVPRTSLRAYEIRENDFSQEPHGRRIFDTAGIGRRNKFYFFEVADVERGILTGVHVHTRKGGSIVERIDAEKAIWDEPTARWHLKNGTVKKIGSRGAVEENIPFSSMEAPFRESPKTLEIYSSGTGEFSIHQLRRQIKNLERSGYDAQRLKVDYHMKFSLPVANMIVIFLALPFALECRRGGLTIGFALSLTAALLYYGTFQIGLALGKGGSLPAVVSAWLANFLFLGIGAGLTMKART